MGALALLLAIDLLVLPWFSGGGGTVTTPVGVISVSGGSLTGVDGPDSWLGVLAVISSIALIADLAIERTSPSTALPNIGGSRTKTRFALAGLTAVFIALKFLFNIHFSYFGFGFWAAVVLTAALVFSTLRVSNEQPILNTK